MNAIYTGGCYIIENFLSKIEEEKISNLDILYPGNCRTSPNQPARMLRFGDLKLTEGLKNDKDAKDHGYKSGRRSYGAMNDGIDVSVPSKDEPLIIKLMKMRLWNMNIVNKYPELCVLNIYNENQRIGRHIDHLDNGPIIPIIGLDSDSQLIFTNKTKTDSIVFELPRRALFVMKGELRNDYFHETPSIKYKRKSLVFRCI